VIVENVELFAMSFKAIICQIPFARPKDEHIPKYHRSCANRGVFYEQEVSG
jgi:hypothetical protein